MRFYFRMYMFALIIVLHLYTAKRVDFKIPRRPLHDSPYLEYMIY